MDEDDAYDDPIDKLRFALWGEQDPATGDIRQAAARDAELADEIDELRRIRDGMQELAAWTPTPDELARVRTRLEAVEPPPADPRRYVADRVPLATGFRTADTAECQYRKRTGSYDADFHLFPGPLPGQFDVSGQLIRLSSEPARGVCVVLVVDGVDTDTTTTDEYGEYRFKPGPARTLAVRAEDGELVEEIEIWNQDKERDDDR